MIKKVVLLSLFVSLGGLINAAVAKSAADSSKAGIEKFIAGKDYDVLPTPVATRNKEKVEVVELFWYGCGHCYTFDQIFKPWAAKQASDVDVVQMPAIWNKTMELHARAFYAAQALNKINELHGPLFNAIIVKRERLFSPDALANFFEKYGVDKKTFENVMTSFGVDSQVALAQSRGRSYKMRGTPEMVVNGKYRLSVEKAKSQPRMLEIADFLIEKERKHLPKAAEPSPAE
ncbi:MAG: thiol:disulfide interchange protein DsbA/DsbL [Cellvibrionales bacterium]|nr:thiol:disulfide interchange protein DsbA/DsbL [Cellvibrionales bacterium]